MNGHDGVIDHTDRSLTRRAAAGDDDAFAALVTRHASSALRVATVVLGSADGAGDVVQEAALKAWGALGRLDPERGFRAWFLKIVANTARNDRRTRSRQAALAVRASTVRPLHHPTPEVEAVTTAERERVVEALNRLGSDDRLVVALRYFEELSQAEIAVVLGCPTGTAKSRLSRAMGRLRQVLAEEAEEADELP